MDVKTERRKDGKTERWIFFVKCRRTNVLNNAIYMYVNIDLYTDLC